MNCDRNDKNINGVETIPRQNLQCYADTTTEVFVNRLTDDLCVISAFRVTEVSWPFENMAFF